MAKSSTISIGFRIDDKGNGLKQLIVDGGELRKVMQANVEEAKKLQNNYINLSSFANGVKGAMDAYNGLLSSVAGDSADFSRAMKEANTMAGKDSAGFAKMKGEVAELAKTLPLAREELAQGLYQTISNGVPEDNWLTFLNASARSAVGGLADINQVVGVTSTLIKNYGLEWSAAGDIQDKIQLTAKNGVTSFEQLAAALPRVAGNAATLGVSVDELMGTFATLTGVSGNTAEVSTQLAAIFTALVKPSSEAGKMAEEMGLQFDAAAVKAAGGFQNFLKGLDQSVKEYSAASGVLEQEVYAKLFGSAESLRALIPLQGELSAKFGENVANMVNSAGTMDKAFADIDSTGGAAAQRLQNKWGVVSDKIMEVTAGMKPLLTMAGKAFEVGGNISILIVAVKTLGVSLGVTKLKTVALTAAQTGLKISTITLSAITTTLKSAFTGAAVGATTLKVALRGLAAATVVGAVIAALGFAVEKVMGYFDGAADSTDKFTTAEEEAKNESEALKTALDETNKSVADSRAQLELEIAKLKDFKGTKQEEARIVSELNSRYGETMGTFKSVSEWYEALCKNSDTYCKKIMLEARTRVWANRIAELEQKKYDLTHNADGTPKMYSKQRQTRDVWKTANGYGSYKVKEEIAGTSRHEQANASYRELTKALHNYKSELEKDTKAIGSLSMVVMGSPLVSNPPKRPGADSSAGRSKSGGTSKEPLVFNAQATTIKEIANNIAYLNAQLENTADLEAASNINRQIRLWEQKADAIRDAGKAVEETAAIVDNTNAVNMGASSLKDIEANITALNARLSEATNTDAAARINGQIAQWQKLADSIRNAGTAVAELNAGANTIKSISDNIAILNERLENTSDLGEVAVLKQQIELWEKKADAIRKTGDKASVTMSTFSSGWSSVKNSVSAIESVSEALKGNGSAWEKTVAIIDGFFTLMESITSIVQLVSPFISVTRLSTVAKTAEAVAIGSSAAAAGVEAGADAANAAAKLPMIVANKAATASFIELAAAQYMAAHAYIPFAGVGIGTSMSMQAAALVKSMGVLTAFADGGIVSGPTAALVGEYPGASHNPEVIAPLDKLRSLITPTDSGPQNVTFKIEGRTLVGVLEKEANHRRRV